MNRLIKAVKLLLIVVALLLISVLASVIFLALAPGLQGVIATGVVLLLISMLVAVLPTLAIVLLPRRRPVWHLLNHLEQAVRLNLPLPQMMDAVCEAQGGGFARSVARARDLLERGAPLAVALQVIPAMPGRVVAMVDMGERSGRLPQALGRIMQQRRAAVGRGAIVSYHSIYPLLLTLVMFAVTMMLMVFVVPKFEQILWDFHAPMPRMLRTTLGIARMVASPGGLVVLVGLGAAAVLGIGVVLRRRHDLGETRLERLLNGLPLIGTVSVHREMGDALDCAADAVESGRPMDAALGEAAGITRNSRVRTMFNRWIQAMQRGGSIADAARDAGLPPLVAGMLATAVHTADLGPILRFLARYYSARFSRSLALLRGASVPAMVLVLGFMIGWLAISFFMPLIVLSEQAMTSFGGR